MKGKLRPCRVRETGRLYRSVRAALIDLGLTPDTYYERALSGLRVAGRWHIELLNEDHPDYRAARAAGAPVRRSSTWSVRCIDTGRVYRSAADAARAHGVTATAVYMAVRNGTRCVGMHWEYAATEVAS